MMIKNKQRELINLLIHSQNTYKTSANLALKLSLSDRTIRTYIKDLKDIIERNGAVLVCKQGLGYKIKITDRTLFDLFFIENNFADKNSAQSKSREASERRHYLLNLFLLEDQQVDIYELSDSLFISLSQLNKDIADIKKQLKSYGLTVQKNRSLVFVEGNERAKRHFIMRYFFHQKSVNFLQQLTHSNRFDETISFDSLMIIILDECRESHIKLSDVMIQNIVLHLSLSIKRLQSGFSIQHIDIPDFINDSVEFNVAKNILNRVQSVIGFDFPKEEQRYLTLHLLTKSNVITPSSDEDLNASLRHLLMKMQEETGYFFLQDTQLRSGLEQHLKPMLMRLSQGVKLENPLLTEIKEQYSDFFTLIKNHCREQPCFRNFDINDDEWGYWALHFLASVEKLKNEQKAKVLIVCATGLGSAQLLRNRIESEFDDKIKIIGTKGYYEITPEVLDGIDFIISSVDLSTKIFKTPIFQVSVFLNEQDVQQIRHYFLLRQEPSCNRNLCNPIKRDVQKEQNMLVSEQIIDSFSKDYFRVYQNNSSISCEKNTITKEKVIDDLLNILSSNEKPDYKDQMIKQIENRISFGDVFFSSTIIVPHPAISIGKLAKMAIALIPNGLFWNEQYPEIKFVFLISPSKYKNSNLEIMTKAIVALIDDLEIQKSILKSHSFKEFKKYFMKLIDKGI